MSGAFPIDEAQIVGLFMECVFYGAHDSIFRAHEQPTSPPARTGIYLVTFGLCLRALLLDRERAFAFKPARIIRWGMVVVALLMFIFGTFDGTSSVLSRAPVGPSESDSRPRLPSCVRPQAQPRCVHLLQGPRRRRRGVQEHPLLGQHHEDRRLRRADCDRRCGIGEYPECYACSCLAVVSPRAQAPPPTRTMLMRGE